MSGSQRHPTYVSQVLEVLVVADDALRCRDIAEFEHFPFCSERCKMVDLGRWLGGHYHISTDETPEHDEQKNT